MPGGSARRAPSRRAPTGRRAGPTSSIRSRRSRGGSAAPPPRRPNDGKPLSAADRKALAVLGLETDADRRQLRQRYSDLVRRYHPDRNGGDRRHEGELRRVIEAYQALKGSAAFA